MEATAKANIRKFWGLVLMLKIPWWNPCSARCELGRLFSRVIIKRVFLQNSLHIKLDYHYVYLVKDFFLLRLELFLYSQSCCGHITGLLLQRYDRLQAVRINPWLFFSPVKNHFCIWTGYQQTENETHIASNLKRMNYITGKL